MICQTLFATNINKILNESLELELSRKWKVAVFDANQFIYDLVRLVVFPKQWMFDEIDDYILLVQTDRLQTTRNSTLMNGAWSMMKVLGFVDRVIHQTEIML